MISIAQAISDVKSEFEGGGSLTVDWYVIFRRAANKLLGNINPETLKRTVPIYGGLTKDLQVYYCPTDVEVPSRLYSRDRSSYFDYMPPAQFYGKQNFLTFRRNKFTIEYVNGVRFIVVYYPVTVATQTLTEATSITGFTGNASLILNNFNVLPGKNQSLQGTFSDTVYNVKKTLDTPIDITALLNGVALIPVYLDTVADVDYLKLRIYTDDWNYYEFTSTQDSVGDNLRDGQNFVRFWLPNRVATGTPTDTNIVKWELDVKMKAAKSQTVILGKLTLQESHLFSLEYYSKYLFSSATGAWSDTPAKGYNININRDTEGILHFEACKIVFRAAKVSRIDPISKQDFDVELLREYSQYNHRHPSSEQPLSYNISPDIPYSPAIFGEGYTDFDFGERVGEDTAAEQTYIAYFADDETPVGLIDGINTTYALAHMPNPTGSLVLVLNGVTSQGGVIGAYNFTLSGKTITFTTPIDPAFAGLLSASYRYSVT